MKKLVLLSIITLASTFAFSQKEARPIPSANIKNLDGETVNTKKFNNEGKPMIINFWATWCTPCKRELNNIADVYDDWVEETGVKLIAISIDDSRNAGKVAPYVNGKGWDYEVYIDANQDFQRAIGFQNPPFTAVIDANGQIVWTHSGYVEGDEEKLYEIVKKVAAGEKIDHK
ncbi:MAG: TlpA disulfide reductase family protein [Vicingaceae bacterium]|nr:TlpA disulfide reductase family protein [Vicingaceae bacterium]